MILRSFILTACALFLNTAVPCAGSEPGADESSLYFYRVTFTDKGDAGIGDFALKTCSLLLLLPEGKNAG